MLTIRTGSWVAAIVAALVVAGCGSSGVSNKAFNALKAEKAKVEAALTAAEKDAAGLQQQLAAAQAASADPAELQAAKDDVARLQNDLAEAEAEADVADLQQQLAAAQAKLDGATGETIPDLNNQIAEIESEKAALQAELEAKKAELAMAKDRQRRLAHAGAMILAAYDHDGNGARPNVLKAIEGAALVADSLVVEYDDTDGYKPVVQKRIMGDDGDMLSRELDRPEALDREGYKVYRFEGQTGASEASHVVLYTDKGEPPMRPEISDAADDGNVYSDGRTTAGSPNPGGTWTDAKVSGPTEPQSGLGGRFVSTDSQIRGNYGGVPGVYSCMDAGEGAAGCFIPQVVSEKSEELRGVIKFTPDEPKDDYLTFGVWLTVPDSANDMHSVSAFARGGDPFDGDHAKGLSGTATYEGPAVGVYGKRAINSETADVGSFTAQAMLTADFGDGMVYGKVTDFMEGSEKLPWKVQLRGGDSVDSEMAGAPFGGDTRISKSGRVDSEGNFEDLMGKGKWNGKFYGNGEMASDHPRSMAGTFGVKVGSPDKKMSDDMGYLGITGAFGAKKQAPQPQQ